MHMGEEEEKKEGQEEAEVEGRGILSRCMYNEDNVFVQFV